MWLEQLPSCMNPESPDDRIKFVDLVKKSLFYFCLEDKFLQEQLCNLKDDDLTLKIFLMKHVSLSKSGKVFKKLVYQVLIWIPQLA